MPSYHRVYTRLPQFEPLQCSLCHRRSRSLEIFAINAIPFSDGTFYTCYETYIRNLRFSYARLDRRHRRPQGPGAMPLPTAGLLLSKRRIASLRDRSRSGRSRLPDIPRTPPATIHARRPVARSRAARCPQSSVTSPIPASRERSGTGAALRSCISRSPRDR
jgi:hypothetical protein